MTGDFLVTSISIEGEMDVMMYGSINCYNQRGTPLSNNTEQGLLLSRFTVSVTKNKFEASITIAESESESVAIVPVLESEISSKNSEIEL